jgi:hypothetical protein
VDPEQCAVDVWSPHRAAPDRVTDMLVWRPAALDREIVIDLGSLFDEVCDEGPAPE